MSIAPHTLALLDNFLGAESNVDDALTRIETALVALTWRSEWTRGLVMDLEPTEELLGALESLRNMENEALETFRECAELIRGGHLLELYLTSATSLRHTRP